MSKVLLVDDDQAVSSLLLNQLKKEGYLVDYAKNGEEAFTFLQFYTYDLLILDWMLPDFTGLEICKKYRSGGGTANILMLTGRQEIEDKEEGLDAGADDYLTKPFHNKELSARVRALLRRPKAIKGELIEHGDLMIDTRNGRVTKNGKEIRLVPKELSILELLLRYKNQSFPAEVILERVWGSDSSASLETVRTHIKTLRKKIDDGDKQSIIQTTRGLGYEIQG